MKKFFLFFVILLLFSIYSFAVPPKKYVKDTYGTKAVFFDEDIEDELNDDKISSRSHIYFFNSTSHEITFEFHELKTKLGHVVSDKIFPIRGREKEITINANEYFDSRATNGDIEHFLFVFKDKIYKIFAYSDILDFQKSDRFSIIFEFADE